MVVAEHTSPVKAKFVEIIGYYNVSRTPRELVVQEDRVKYWISVGAQPTETVASLLKNQGMQGMEKYISIGAKKRKKTKGGGEEAAPSGAQMTEAPAAAVVTEAPVVEEAAPAPVEEVVAPTEEVVAEAPVEAPAVEEAAAPEAPSEETPA